MPQIPTAVLISGNGSNLQALMDVAAAEDYPAEIALVISNNPEAYGLKRAKKANIPTVVIKHQHYADREAFDQAMHQQLLEYNIEFVCLAGFMRLLSPEFVSKWEGRILNIHPSLLPAFKGLDAIGQALNAGVDETGCTVHLVTEDMDAGPIVLQQTVPILPDDTTETLTTRMHQAEHTLYPAALKKILEEI